MLNQILAIIVSLALIVGGLAAMYTSHAYAAKKCITVLGHTFCFEPLPPIKCNLPKDTVTKDIPICHRGS